MSFELILPFLRPIEHLILDPDITEIMVNGSRVAAVFAPCSVGGTTLRIRRFQTKFFTAEELVRIGTMTPDVLGR